LQVTYVKSGGKKVTLDVKIPDAVYPGKKITYKKHLLDIFSNTKSLDVKVKSAQVISSNAL
jgi:hypothetical protein